MPVITEIDDHAIHLFFYHPPACPDGALLHVVEDALGGIRIVLEGVIRKTKKTYQPKRVSL